MSHLDVENRVYPTGFDDDPECEAQCLWFALCDNPANGVADAGPRGPLPVCKRCADQVGITEFIVGGIG
ncbi:MULTISPECIES: hypothetical protein [Mycolicibacterium]|uniref:hypothetical protein n=1 Tax=Mycolicibacterium TaxID=1866885 RepID=UPI0026350FD3|nr:hypothetical protein [Mycolicibacterium fortuitum]